MLEPVRSSYASGEPIEFTELTRIGHYAMGGYVDSLRQAGAWMWAQWER